MSEMNEPLAVLNFMLEPEAESGTLLEKTKFPVVLIPKESQILFNGNIVTVSGNSNEKKISETLYTSNSNISRPRNRFILARNILSKVVKHCVHLNSEDVSTDDISKWHESYFPSYHYVPKNRSDSNSKFTRASTCDVIVDHFPHFPQSQKAGGGNTGKFENVYSFPKTNHHISGYSSNEFILDSLSENKIEQSPLTFNNSSVFSPCPGEFSSYKGSGNSFQVNEKNVDILKNGAEDIEDVSKYLTLCSTSYNETNDKIKNSLKKEKNTQDDQNYKDFTLRLSFKTKASKSTSKRPTKPKITKVDKIAKKQKNDTKKSSGILNFGLFADFEIMKSPYNFGKASVEDIINRN
ncbi:hypothetical protein WICMUC_000508 [Wickerhamomyces mucosus]|uniref:Uncharacterized protein n=1 Tax=Wickerhamomyces mucosus TaxID=1378264 RepID=A0A9P8PXQ5_9ASCO|nr:hypothetical protein WICMUC_000508 [Wickerhamomyces mucosus]